jgi:hypothetical protein
MTNVSKSPERHTFQVESYIARCKEEGTEPSEDYLNLYKSARQQDEERMVDPAWQTNNLEYDLRSTAWILEKVRGDDVYAQHLYAAMCNMQFVKNDVWPLLKDQRWSCSWRHAGGIIADMQEKGDYIDWYCSGIRGEITEEELKDPTDEQQAFRKKIQAYVGEGTVTEEIRVDLLKLGWIPQEWEDD